jgi:DNA-directed RNA polymerase subunit M/transcription elongation factor TFIIS/DNA-directed RNA polymerase subunit RPC12/RpoP
MEYLLDKQNYIDRYDLRTIKDCLEMIDINRKAYIEGKKQHVVDEKSRGEFAKSSNWITNQILFQIKGERYKNKEETIERWMLEDKLQQDKYDNTPDPQKACPKCNVLMSMKVKHLEILETPLRMMFLYECSQCNKRLWVYEDGTLRPTKPELCPKCNNPVITSISKEDKKKIIWKTKCKSCGYTNTIVDDIEKEKLEAEKKDAADKHLLKTYREEFCSENVGKEAYEYTEALKVANEVYNEELRKYDSPAYHAVINLKKLTSLELHKTLMPIFEKEGYINLVFGQPEIEKHVIVNFTCQDNDASRKNTRYADLKKQIKVCLESTNWRLMPDSLSLRLGYLTGKIKGFEQEEDFIEITGHKPVKETAKTESKERMTYVSHKVVQFARLSGEFQGIENARKRRLKDEPEGFFLDGDGVYTCGICGENHVGKEIWWNEQGIRCADCWRNIKDGTIPHIKSRHDDDVGYFLEWFIKSDIGFGINYALIRKLKKDGLLKGRELKRQDGSVYCTIYLESENQEFINKYPRKKCPGMIITDILGDKIEL